MNVLDTDFALQNDTSLSLSVESNVSITASGNTTTTVTTYDEVTALLKNLELRRRQNRARTLIKGESNHRTTKKANSTLGKTTRSRQRSKVKSSA